jgi:hypothetical protein
MNARILRSEGAQGAQLYERQICDIMKGCLFL